MHLQCYYGSRADQESIIVGLNYKSSGQITIVNSISLTETQVRDHMWILAERTNNNKHW